MLLLPLSNNEPDKHYRLQASFQVCINIVANNVVTEDPKKHTTPNLISEVSKTKGLLIKDFLISDNKLVLIHGRVVTCYDLMNLSKEP